VASRRKGKSSGDYEIRGIAMKLTTELIHSISNKRGGWSRSQLKALGIEWPPLSGWLRALDGTEISDEQWKIAKELQDAHLKKKRNPTKEPDLFGH